MPIRAKDLFSGAEVVEEEETPDLAPETSPAQFSEVPIPPHSPAAQPALGAVPTVRPDDHAKIRKAFICTLGDKSRTLETLRNR